MPLPEKNYGGNCLIYDPDKPEDPYHNFWVKLILSIVLSGQKFLLQINL